jgi:hypothetical protein
MLVMKDLIVKNLSYKDLAYSDINCIQVFAANYVNEWHIIHRIDVETGCQAPILRTEEELVG